MELKRVYEIPEGWVKQVNEEIPLVIDGKAVLDRGVQVMTLVDPTKPKGECLNPPPVVGVVVVRAGPRQNFSPELIAKGSQQGWLTMGGGKILVHGEDGMITYKVEHAPGLFCCHCGDELDDEASARTHVKRVHVGVASPDSNNPAGYERANYYGCVKE